MKNDKYNLTSMFTVNEEFVLAYEEGMVLPIKIYLNRSNKHVMAIDFSKMKEQ